MIEFISQLTALQEAGAFAVACVAFGYFLNYLLGNKKLNIDQFEKVTEEMRSLLDRYERKEEEREKREAVLVDLLRESNENSEHLRISNHDISDKLHEMTLQRAVLEQTHKEKEAVLLARIETLTTEVRTLTEKVRSLESALNITPL